MPTIGSRPAASSAEVPGSGIGAAGPKARKMGMAGRSVRKSLTRPSGGDPADAVGQVVGDVQVAPRVEGGPIGVREPAVRRDEGADRAVNSSGVR